jgi:hypothetical protein
LPLQRINWRNQALAQACAFYSPKLAILSVMEIYRQLRMGRRLCRLKSGFIYRLKFSFVLQVNVSEIFDDLGNNGFGPNINVQLVISFPGTNLIQGHCVARKQ